MSMKWFKNMIIRWVRDDWENAKHVPATPKLVANQEVEAVSEADPILNFRVFSAVGGKIVEFRRYDRQRDRHDIQTYIITNEQDFGERIAKIATMENLKS
jgi:hypothetical protein